MEFIKRHPVICYFVFVMLWCSLAWSFLVPGVAQFFHMSVPGWVFWLGECSPGGAAIIMSLLLGGKKRCLSLLLLVVKWRVHAIYYYLVIVLVAYFYLAATGLSAMLGVPVPSFSSLYQSLSESFGGISPLWLLPLWSIIYIFCEELGWRGFALQELLKKYDLFYASLIIGFLWAFFHVPLMLQNMHNITVLYLVIYLVVTLLDSFLFAWLFIKTGRSLLLVGILHGATNLYGAFSPTIIASVGQGENLRTALLKLILILPIVIWVFIYRKKHYADPAINSFN